jgi:hypothetical protein
MTVPIQLPAHLTGATVDLGARGLGFLAPRRYHPGEQLHIQVMLPVGRPLTMRAQVIWCKETSGDARLRFRCGAKLSAIGVRESLFLKDYLEARSVA